MIHWCVGTWKDWCHFAKGRRIFSIGTYAQQLHPREFKQYVEDIERDHECYTWTNNPCILDHVKPEAVVCVHGGKHRRLSEHPKWKTWKDEMTAGEFWSFVGESWVSDKQFDRRIEIEAAKGSDKHGQ